MTCGFDGVRVTFVHPFTHMAEQTLRSVLEGRGGVGEGVFCGEDRSSRIWEKELMGIPLTES